MTRLAIDVASRRLYPIAIDGNEPIGIILFALSPIRYLTRQVAGRNNKLPLHPAFLL